MSSKTTNFIANDEKFNELAYNLNSISAKQCGASTFIACSSNAETPSVL